MTNLDRLHAWCDAAELRSVTVTRRALERKNRGTHPDPIQVTARGPGLELTADGGHVESCAAALLAQLRALAPER